MSILVLHGPNSTPTDTHQAGGHGIKTLPQIEEELAQITTNAGTLLHVLHCKNKGALIDRSRAATSDGTEPSAR